MPLGRAIEEEEAPATLAQGGYSRCTRSLFRSGRRGMHDLCIAYLIFPSTNRLQGS